MAAIDSPNLAPITTNGNEIDPPKVVYTNDAPVAGGPTTPALSRGVVANTSIAAANANLAHVCDFISEMQKNINLKKYTKALAKQIRDAIRYIMKALGFSDTTGEASWLANTLKSFAREVNRINKEILQPILEFEKYVLAYVAKLRAIIAWILSLPARLLALLQDCLAKLIKLIGAIFTDIGAGLSEGFSTGDNKQTDEILKEAKSLAAAASNTVQLSVAAVVGVTTIAGAATVGLLVPTSQSELDAANATIAAYEAPAKPPVQNKSTP